MTTALPNTVWDYRPRNIDFGEVTYHDPRLLPDAEKGIQRIRQSIETGEFIFILGDYDADGLQSSHILASAVRDCGGVVHVRIPERIEGYGAKPEHVDEAVQAHAKLLIMIDNGSTAFHALNRAEDLKIDVVIIDHHNVLNDHIKTAAFINPKRPGSKYPFPEICSTLLALKLADLLYDSYGFPKDYAEERFLDTAAIGTIGDMMPLLGENRRVVIDGLKRVNMWPNRHTRALKFSLLTADILKARDVAFQIVPAINATSRLGNAKLAQEFFEATHPSELMRLSQELRDKNDLRRKLREEWAGQVKPLTPPESSLILAHHDDVPVGLIGLVATELGNEDRKPCIVTTKVVDDSGTVHFKGSGRSVQGFSLYQYVMAMPDEWFDARGGHDEALGVTIKEGHLQDVIDYVAINQPVLAPPETLYYSDILNFIVQQMAEQDALEPFGAGNPYPIYLVPQLMVTSVRNRSGIRQCKGNFYGEEVRFKTVHEVSKGNQIRALAVLERDMKGEPQLNLTAIERCED